MGRSSVPLANLPALLCRLVDVAPGEPPFVQETETTWCLQLETWWQCLYYSGFCHSVGTGWQALLQGEDWKQMCEGNNVFFRFCFPNYRTNILSFCDAFLWSHPHGWEPDGSFLGAVQKKDETCQLKVLELWGFVRFVGLFIFFSFLP